MACTFNFIGSFIYDSDLTIFICFLLLAQRQVGETALNDTSSRSHQIIRLVSFSAIKICCYLWIFTLATKLGMETFFFSFGPMQTIQSTLRENSDCVRSFVATLVIRNLTPLQFTYSDDFIIVSNLLVLIDYRTSLIWPEVKGLHNHMQKELGSEKAAILTLA